MLHSSTTRRTHITPVKATLFLYISLFLFACSKEEVREKEITTTSEHLALGNPSGATSDVSTPSNYLMEKPQYALSYNRDRGTPNWVSWHLDRSWLGTAERQDDFREDNTLPEGWYRVKPTDYSLSGFDRGHGVPSADRTKTEEDNSSTFLMTNIIPQAPNHNRQLWENLERYCRTLAEQGNELYIAMGSYGIGGTGSAGFMNSIAGGKITVPARIWKVVVALPEGSNDAARVTTATRVIAVNTPNSDTVSASWSAFRTSVDAIEGATGYNLFSSVTENVQSAIEGGIDNGPTE
jgi:endonuclease G